MGNLAHDRCYGTDKSTQKSGYGELTRRVPPLEKGLLHTSPFAKGGWRGIFKISPKPLFTKEGRTPPPCLALRASVNGLTVSPSVLNGAHYSSHQHPSPLRGGG